MYTFCPAARQGPIYLAATKKDRHKRIMDGDELGLWFGTGSSYTLGEHSRYIEKVIKPTTTSRPRRSNYIFCLFEAYPTELSGLDDALDEVPDDYYAWLISNSYKDVEVIQSGVWPP